MDLVKYKCTDFYNTTTTTTNNYYSNILLCENNGKKCSIIYVKVWWQNANITSHALISNPLISTRLRLISCLTVVNIVNCFHCSRWRVLHKSTSGKLCR